MTKTQTAALVSALAQMGFLAGGNGKSAKGRKGKGRGRSQGRVKLSEAELTANAAANAKEVEELFTAKGYKNNVAHETILTYKKWIEKGRKVKAGEKSLKPKSGVPLFHLDQTEPVEAVAQTAAAPTTETVQ